MHKYLYAYLDKVQHEISKRNPTQVPGASGKEKEDTKKVQEKSKGATKVSLHDRLTAIMNELGAPPEAEKETKGAASSASQEFSSAILVECLFKFIYFFIFIFFSNPKK